jgi:ATP-dependent DNA helicase RecG
VDASQLPELLRALIALPHEVEWVEFKHNNSNLKLIGEYLSALANSATLHSKEAGYIVWGIDDASRTVIGTGFKPRQEKVGNEELENWLHHQLHPSTDFHIHEFVFEGKPVVLFEVRPASHAPIRFEETEFIRVGSYKKKLKDFPEKERLLWVLLSDVTFEKGVARSSVSTDEVLALLDYPAYFTLTGQPLPDNRAGILDRLTNEKIIAPKGSTRYDITNFGAILFARNLNEFERLARKAVRVIVYKGDNRVHTVKEQVGGKGYAVGFEGVIAYINDQLPKNEQIGQAFRKEVRMYPELAIRELVPNALIHQDFMMTGTGPMVEIFSDRIEITDPGVPLIDTLRFIDEPPRSRNEALAAFMRRINICEERGSGIDKVIFQVELFQLPAPEFVVTANHTKATLFAYRKLADMDRMDRIRACYQHACLRYVSRKEMTNASLRGRFAIEERNYSIASRIISDTIQEGLVRAADPANKSKKHASYVPFWA